MNANGNVRIEALGRENYDTWKLQMRALLVKNDAWGYVSGEITKPEIVEGDANSAAAVRDWKIKDEKAKSDLILSIGASQLKQIKNCATSRELWIKLESIFQSKGPARKATLLKSLTLQKMNEGGDVREHLHEFFDAVDKLSEMDVNINPDQLAIMMLYSLPSSYENFRCAIESRDQLPTPENLRTKITEEYEARRAATSTPQQGAMLADKKKWKPKNRHGKDDQNKSKKFEFRCFKCHKEGHKSSECTTKRDKKPASVSLLSTIDEGDVCQMTTNSDKSVWCLDSGCTSHLCKDINTFTEIKKSEPGNLKLASNASAEIKAKGAAEIVVTLDGKRSDVTLTDTLHVPELRTNLLSVSKITDKGYKVIFNNEKATIMDKHGSETLVARRINNLYYVEGASPQSCRNAEHEDKKNTTKSANHLLIWHRRMGHLNFRDLISAPKNGAIRGIDIQSTDKDPSCEICIQGKMTRPSFPKESSRETEKLGIIHTDVCGPMRVPSNGGSIYMVTFTDDHTRWTEVRFIKNKSQVFEEFKTFKALVEKQLGMKIKSIQSDNGREYVNKEFDEYLKSEGIQRRLTTAYTPEQNGVAERKNRTLVESARCLLLQSGLSPYFWAEAICTANYIRNRCPTKKLDGRTPYEAWHDKVPTVKHFKEFGCKVYCLDRSPTKGKFEARSRKGVFIGYSEESKGFRVWLPDSRKVEITRDVRFLEGHVEESRGSFEDFYSESNTRDHTDDDPKASEIDIQLTPRKPDAEEDFQEIVDEIETEDEIDQPVRRRGRPRIIRTGRPGRPRKDYGENEQEAEFAFLAEIPTAEAISGANSSAWKEAMASEVKSLIKKKTWSLVERPEDQKVIGSRFVLRNKYDSSGNLATRKARVVARGFAQKPGVDFNETFAPVARLSSIRAAAAIAVQHDMKIEQLDITTAYLNSDVEERIFMEPPMYLKAILEHIVRAEQGDKSVRETAKKMWKELEEKDVVCLLKKALYGLRQAGRAWHTCLDGELRSIGAVASEADPCVYRVGEAKSICFIIIYVDDILLVSRDDETVRRLKNHLSTKFEVKELGSVKHCLGLEFTRSKKTISISQRGYILDILDRFGMSECRPTKTPLDPGQRLIVEEDEEDKSEASFPYRKLIGALMYLSVGTRPDIAHAVSHLSQFNDCHGETHWKAAKRVLRYLKGTSDIGLVFKRSDDSPVMFADADWGGCNVDRRSYTGYVFIASGAAVSWESKKQQTVALSSTESEYMALSEATKEALYMRRLLKGFGTILPSVVLKNDNLGAQKLVANPVYHSRTKHIDIRHHFVRDAVKKEIISIEYTPTDQMPADVLTKGLSAAKHENCIHFLGLRFIE